MCRIWLAAILSLCLGLQAAAGPLVNFTTTLNVAGSEYDAIDFFYASSPGAEFTNYRIKFETSNGPLIYDPLPNRQDAGSDAIDTFMNTVGSFLDLGNASHIQNTYHPSLLNPVEPATISRIDWSVFDTLIGDANTVEGFAPAPYHLGRVLVKRDALWHATFMAFDTVSAGVPQAFNFTNDPNWTFPEPVVPLPPPPPPPEPPPAEPLPPLETPPQPGPPEAPPIDDVVDNPPSDDPPANDPWEAEPPIDEPSVPPEEPPTWVPPIDRIPLLYIRPDELPWAGQIGTIFPWDGASFIEVYPWTDRLIDVTSIIYEDGGQPFTPSAAEGIMWFHTGATSTTTLTGHNLGYATALTRLNSSASAAADSGVPEPTSAILATLALLGSSLARARRR